MASRFYSFRAVLVLIAVLVLPALACDFSVSTASITNGVMAKDVKGDNADPVGITDTFPANVIILHAVVTISNAPSDTAVKIVWLDPSNTSMGEYELKAEGSRNLDFSFKPNGAMPAGNYKAEIYLNGKLDRTLAFTVEALKVQPTVVPTKPPSLATGCPPLPSVSAKPSGIVASVTLAQDTKGDLREPANPTAVFKPESIFHAVTAIQNAPANSKFAATWFMTDVGSAAPCNTRLDSTEVVTDGSRNIDFTLKPAATWPVGTYRVEIMVNGVLDRIVSFSVSASSAGQPAAVPPTAAPPAQVKPTPTSQSAPAVPPGLYVSALRLDPGPKRGVDITFYPMFLNTTGGAPSYRVRVYLYRADNLRTSFGETTAAPITIPAGSTEQKAAGSWKLGGGGECEDFVARVGWVDDQNRVTFFNATGGGTFESRLRVCP